MGGGRKILIPEGQQGVCGSGLDLKNARSLCFLARLSSDRTKKMAFFMSKRAIGFFNAAAKANALRGIETLGLLLGEKVSDCNFFYMF